MAINGPTTKNIQSQLTYSNISPPLKNAWNGESWRPPWCSKHQKPCSKWRKSCRTSPWNPLILTSIDGHGHSRLPWGRCIERSFGDLSDIRQNSSFGPQLSKGPKLWSHGPLLPLSSLSEFLEHTLAPRFDARMKHPIQTELTTIGPPIYWETNVPQLSNDPIQFYHILSNFGTIRSHFFWIWGWHMMPTNLGAHS